MVGKQEKARAEARIRRALAKRDAEQKAKAIRERTANAVSRARQVVTDPTFVKVLRSQGIQTLPRKLATNAGQNQRAENHRESSEENLSNQSLDFVIAWAFLYPLFSNPVIATQLETLSPGFTLELRDAFISLVVDGPFSY